MVDSPRVINIRHILAWIRIESDVRQSVAFRNALPFESKMLRNEPKHGSIVLPHFWGRAKHAEKHHCLENATPFIIFHSEHRPPVGTPCAGWYLNDSAERQSGHAVVHVLPTDIRMVQGDLSAPRNCHCNKGDEHGELKIKHRVHAGHNHEPIVLVVRDIPAARQKDVHLFALAQEYTQCQSYRIKIKVWKFVRMIFRKDSRARIAHPKLGTIDGA